MTEEKKKRYFKAIEGEKVYLSPVHPDDVEKYVEMLNRPEVFYPLHSIRTPLTIPQEKELLEKMLKNGYHYAIVKKDDDTFLGNASIRIQDDISRVADLGAFIGEQKHWGKGYGREVISLLLYHAFRMMNMHSVNIGAFSFNERGLWLYKDMGFQEIGKMREALFLDGKYYHIVLLDMLVDEFEEKLAKGIFTVNKTATVLNRLKRKDDRKS